MGGNSLIAYTTDAEVAPVAMENAINRCNFKASLIHLMLVNRPLIMFYGLHWWSSSDPFKRRQLNARAGTYCLSHVN